MERRQASSYRSIVKGMSVFGGVQIWQWLVAVVRGKIVATLLGPAGMGLQSLMNSTATTIQSLTALGLPLAISREVAAANGCDESESKSGLNNVLATVRRLSLITALLGAVITVASAWWLSPLVTGSATSPRQFAALALVVLFGTLGANELAVLQGLRRVHYIAKASLGSGVVGLCVATPLYIAFGSDGIVPSLIAMVLVAWLMYRHGVGATPRSAASADKSLARNLVAMGFILMAGQLIGQLSVWAVNVYIRWSGGTADVGFFQGVTSICGQSAGMIFAAMAMDYFPRLSASIREPEVWMTVVRRQIEIIILAAAPLTIALMIFAPLVIGLLLDASFDPAIPLLRWMALGTFFQAVAYPMGYIAFAKDNKRLFFALEAITGNVVYVLTTVGFYSWLGLTGLGVAWAVRFLFDVVVYWLVNLRVYGFTFTRGQITLGAVMSIITSLAFAATLLLEGALMYFVAGALLIVASVIGLTGLRNRLRLPR